MHPNLKKLMIRLLDGPVWRLSWAWEGHKAEKRGWAYTDYSGAYMHYFATEKGLAAIQAEIAKDKELAAARHSSDQSAQTLSSSEDTTHE